MELPVNHLKHAMARGEVVSGIWCNLCSEFAMEVVMGAGLDFVIIDTEHGPIDLFMLVRLLQASLASKTQPIVRVPWNEPSMIMKVLDAGAYGVIVPMVSNRAEAERAVGACRYPPVGMRSNGPNRVMLYAGPDYQKHANEEVACIVMIETAEIGRAHV